MTPELHTTSAAPSGAAGAAAPVISLRHLSKRFGGAAALDDVALTIEHGEVHGLLGENGSGKSTLIKVLAGYHVPEPGAELEVNGQPVRLPLAPNRFRELGLAFVHQDLGLIGDLTVLENLRVGDLSSSRSLHIRWSRERRAARETFARYGFDLDPSALVNELPETDRALLAIVRAVEEMRAALAHDQRGLLVLDEPTVFLPREGVQRLFSLVRDVVARDASVLFVSHDLDEVREITDRVTVLRDGRVHATVATREATEAQLVEMIIGRSLAAHHHTAPERPAGEVTLAVRNLGGRTVHDVDFEAHRGEILGLTGIIGSGFDEVPYLLFGARPCQVGELQVGGRSHPLPLMTPRAALKARMALIPADRQVDGSVGTLSVTDNAMLQVLDRYRPAALRLRRLRADTHDLLERFDVRPRDPQADYESLSGGNQQKVLLAKWLQTRPEVLLLHEPTQGVDIGAREQIFNLLRSEADRGTTIVVASSDHEQLAALCDRVLVFGRGRVARELTGGDVTKSRIAEQALNSSAGTASITTEEPEV
ncbi:MAG TPA: sugar ABC transporter ATP-binding protein [Capillimicrobium sp.]|nr:sugar ABC transporter ATP-binding protein [Capillimicrobium sp.]